ncbi:hypothetical protein OXIME_001120 [Oxyplasma meridianum]|uniref:DUF1453 domain-containing protein n=1 Tax=Oxyplasma meridianum TaxID=3073602 RepID=A0AAX4NH89_9ARCH
MIGIFSFPFENYIPAKYQFYFLASLTVFLLLLRLSRLFLGRKYSIGKVLLVPVIYALLSVYTYIQVSTLQKELIIVFGVLGLIAGIAYGKKDRFYVKNNVLKYRSSLPFTLIWTLSFLGEIYIYLYNPRLPISVGFALNIIIAGSAGLILGEAIRIMNSYRIYIKKLSKRGSERN